MKKKSKIITIGLLGLLSVFAGACSLLGVGALDENTAAIYKSSDGLAVSGYDTVAYFKENKPVEGKAEFSTEWNGAKWQFSSAENRDAFQKNPEKYAPQYGGYCAYAVSQGYTASADPQAWKIVDGKLYVNYNKSVKEKWEQDIPNYIASANKNWNDLASKAEESRKDKK